MKLYSMMIRFRLCAAVSGFTSSKPPKRNKPEIPRIRTKELIILDEPTDGFSTEQLDKVRDVLRALDMKQTIIVSHEPKMESYVDSILRINKIDNVSRVIS